MRSLVAFAIVVATYGVAIAQSGEEDAAKADKIFEEAQKLKQVGKTAEACKKYEESLRFNKNAVGTLLNVALCDEESGKVASALKLFTLARDLAREHNLAEHRKAAEEHIAKLQSQVPHLGIAFADIASGMKVVIDDEAVPVEKAGDFGIDPGSHHIVVSAPGRVSYEATVTIEPGKPATLTVPKLGYPVTVKRTRVTVGKIMTFTGAGFVAGSIVLGIVAKIQYENQFKSQDGNPPHCMPAMMEGELPKCDVDGFNKTGNARTLGDVGTAFAIGGGVVAAVGAYLWFFAPKEQPERNVAIVPQLDSESVGVAAIGRF